MTGDSIRGNRVEITDRDGWRKEFPLEKPLLYIGSDPRNDVVLDAQRGGDVAPRHLQLIALPGQAGGGYRAINLSDWNVGLGEGGGRVLAPRAAVEIADGQVLRLGDFGLVFRLGAVPSSPARTAARAAAPAAEPRPEERQEWPSVPFVHAPAAQPRPVPSAAAGSAGFVVEDRSAHIGLKLSLSRMQLTPDWPLEATIMLCNLGDEQAVQFHLEVDGLPADSYQVGPAPILFPHVEKGVSLRVLHPRGPALAAGRHEIRIRASAPDAYPGEEVCVSHNIEIAPYYHHTLSLTVPD